MKDSRKFLRQCTYCREYKKKEDLIRITKNYETNEIEINTGKITGRSVYICKNRECLEKALKKKKIEASLKTKVPEEIKENLYNLLKK